MPSVPQFLEFFNHHPYLFAMLGGAVVLFIVNEVIGSMTAGARMTPLEAVRLINDREPVVIDVRTPSDFKKGHLLNAVNVPAAKIGERAGELAKDKSKPLLVYCALGGSAVEAAKNLRKAGYSEVYPLRGGLNGWISANLPVTAK